MSHAATEWMPSSSMREDIPVYNHDLTHSDVHSVRHNTVPVADAEHDWDHYFTTNTTYLRRVEGIHKHTRYLNILCLFNAAHNAPRARERDRRDRQVYDFVMETYRIPSRYLARRLIAAYYVEMRPAVQQAMNDGLFDFLDLCAVSVDVYRDEDLIDVFFERLITEKPNREDIKDLALSVINDDLGDGEGKEERVLNVNQVDNRPRILNPASGCMVLADGPLGRRIAAETATPTDDNRPCTLSQAIRRMVLADGPVGHRIADDAPSAATAQAETPADDTPSAATETAQAADDAASAATPVDDTPADDARADDAPADDAPADDARADDAAADDDEHLGPEAPETDSVVEIVDNAAVALPHAVIPAPDNDPRLRAVLGESLSDPPSVHADYASDRQLFIDTLPNVMPPSDAPCAICRAGMSVVRLHGQHYYHRHCIEEAFKLDDRCPGCRVWSWQPGQVPEQEPVTQPGAIDELQGQIAALRRDLQQERLAGAAEREKWHEEKAVLVERLSNANVANPAELADIDQVITRDSHSLLINELRQQVATLEQQLVARGAPSEPAPSPPETTTTPLSDDPTWRRMREETVRTTKSYPKKRGRKRLFSEPVRTAKRRQADRPELQNKMGDEGRLGRSDVPSSLRHIDLCAGSGAFTIVARRLKFTTVYANDFSPHSRAMFDANVTSCMLDCRPLETVPFDDLPEQADLLTAGFPCQPFSNASENPQGLADKRAQVFDSIMRVARRCQPRWVVCENVPGIMSMDGGAVFQRVRAKAKTYLSSYKLHWTQYSTATHSGIPQHRLRIYMVWFRDAADYKRFTFPKPTPALRLVSDFLEPEAAIPESCYYANRTGDYAETVLREVVLPVRTTQAVYNRLRNGTMRQNQRRMVPCLTSGMGTGGNVAPVVNDDRGSRMLTPRECFRLQGFSDSYVLPADLHDAALYQVAGNAVSLPIAELVLQALLEQRAQ